MVVLKNGDHVAIASKASRAQRNGGGASGVVGHCLLSKPQDGTAKQRDADSHIHPRTTLVMSF
jgi:hypothetical protein